MRNIPFVMPDEAALARFMETKLINSPRDSGILFAGVSIDVVLSDERQSKRTVVYNIWVGLDRKHEESIASPLIQMLLKDELAQGITVKISSHRGQALTQSA